MLPHFLLDTAFWKTFVTPDRYSYEQIPDLSGKVAIVTGANSGIGYATSLALAAHGCHVFMGCRSETKYSEAATRIQEEIRLKYPNAPKQVKIELLQLDMKDLSKVKASAEEFLRRDLPLHILVNNSGIGGIPYGVSADGIEEIFAVNHLGPFAFTLALLDKLKESQPSRVVTVSSILYVDSTSSGINFKAIINEGAKDMEPIQRYSRSKFANVLFTKALARRLSKDNVYCNVLHPGVVRTEMTRDKRGDKDYVPDPNLDFVSRLKGAGRTTFFKALGMAPERGALTQLYCATSPEIEEKNIRGKFFIPIANELPTYGAADDEEKQEELWKFSEDIISQKLEEAKARDSQSQ